MTKRLSGRFWCLPLVVLGLGALLSGAALSASDPVINEFVCNHTDTDTNEFIELFGDPNTDYSNLTILEIECDGTVSGIIDGIFPVGTTNGDGYWMTGFMGNVIENGSVTIMLVEDFIGNLNDDLDTDNDGVLDVTPFSRIVDDVAVKDATLSDVLYSSVILYRGYDGISYTVGGASRIPNGIDTDTVNDWTRNDFDGEGLPGFDGTPSLGEALNTPGAVNKEVTPPSEPLINEFVCNHTDTDTHEFIEIFGDPNTNYSRFTILEIEGDGTNIGKIDGIFDVTTTDGDGFWRTGFMGNELENGSVTLLLVENFIGYWGQDLDGDNDGMLDIEPFSRIVDDVAVLNGGPTDQVYSLSVLIAGYDGNFNQPGGASRIPNGVDTDTVNDWMRNDFDGEGLPGFVGSPVDGEAFNTPGAVNESVADITPPVITVDLNRTVLWPPNHKMVDIVATVVVTDDRDPTPSFTLQKIESSEPDNGKCDGNTDDDILIINDTEFQLRAERQGCGIGREYSIFYVATDDAGNSTAMTVAVRVPHDMSGSAMPSLGFVPDGTALDESRKRFALVFPSSMGSYVTDAEGELAEFQEPYDAAQIDPHYIYLGTSEWVLRPVESQALDVDGDGYQDLVAFFSTTQVLDLQTKPSSGDLKDVRTESQPDAGRPEALSVHYEAPDGGEHMIANIFALGRVVPLGTAEPQAAPDHFGQDRSDMHDSILRASIYPNPFNPTTTITFELASQEMVSLRIFNVQGKLVRTLKNDVIGPGIHDVYWDGRDDQGRLVASGLYLIRFESPAIHFTRKAMMLK